MAKIHMVLQGKGGVGKSMIAATIAQYKASKGRRLCIDTDPVNAPSRVQSPERAAPEHHGRRRDQHPELRCPGGANRLDQGDVIIDNGASSFVPLSSYLIRNQVPALLQDMGHELVVHTVVTGGQAFLDTLNGFARSPGSSRPNACSWSG
jgi:hypothetical protein